MSSYVEPPDRDGLLAAFRAADPSRGTIARGLGRSYGDPAQNAGGCVLGTSRLDRVLGLDTVAGTVTVEAGVSIGRLCRRLLSEKMFVPVTPGTRAVTFGGAIAADVHGKNHHRDGAFGRHVLAMTLLLADGDVRVVTPQPDGDPELFWGTLGGMGLTGIVLDATVRTLPVQSPWMSVDTRRAESLDALLALLAEADQRRYSVAWVDCLARGRHAGRGVVTSAEHAGPDDVASGAPRRPDPDPPARVRAPGWAPPGLLNRWTVAAFNLAWYRTAPSWRQGERQSPARSSTRWTRWTAGTVCTGRGAWCSTSASYPTLARWRRCSPGCVPPGPRPSWRCSTLRCRRPRPAVLPPTGMDARTRPARGHRRSSVVAGPPRRDGGGCRRQRLPGQGLPDASRAAPGVLSGLATVGTHSGERVDPGGRWRSDQSRRLSL